MGMAVSVHHLSFVGDCLAANVKNKSMAIAEIDALHRLSSDPLVVSGKRMLSVMEDYNRYGGLLVVANSIVEFIFIMA